MHLRYVFGEVTNRNRCPKAPGNRATRSPGAFLAGWKLGNLTLPGTLGDQQWNNQDSANPCGQECKIRKFLNGSCSDPLTKDFWLVNGAMVANESRLLANR